MALIHAPLVPAAAVAMADPALLRRRTPVLASGYSGNRPVQGGGRILRLSRMEGIASGPRWRHSVFSKSAPDPHHRAERTGIFRGQVLPLEEQIIF